jgi:uncharacterized peroxidase-related enzyme
MTWIKTISFQEAGATLKKVYNRVKGPGSHIDNILKAHSLRPHTLVGHMALYKNVLHNANNILPKWFLETIGTYVSQLNACTYCIDHHFAGLKRLLADDEKASDIIKAIKEDNLSAVLNGKYGKAIDYVRNLTLHPNTIKEENINEMKLYFEDGEILEINQVVSYFCYANRTVLGLGVTTEGDILGLSPNESSDPTNWSHR